MSHGDHCSDRTHPRARNRLDVLAAQTLAVLLALAAVPALAQYQYRRTITVDSTKVTNPTTLPIAFDNVTSAITPNAGDTNLSWTHAVGSGNDKIAIVAVSTAQGAGTGTITADSSTSAATGGSTSTTLTWNHSTGAGSNAILVVGVSIRRNGGTQTVSSITYDGTPLSMFFNGSRNQGPNNVRAEIWYLPLGWTTAGTHSIVVTLSAAAHFVAGSATFFGVDQVSPQSAVTRASGTASPATLNLPCNVGDLVIDTVAVQSSATSAPAEGAGQARLWRGASGDATPANNTWGAGSSKPGAASVTMTWTFAPDNNWALVAVALRPGPTNPITQVMFGASNITANLIGSVANSTNCAVSMYYMLNPPAGSNALTVTMSASTRFVAGAFTLFNVDQTTPFGTFASATGSGTAADPADVAIPSVSGQIVVAALAKRYNDAVQPQKMQQQADRWTQSTTNGTSDDVLGVGTLIGGGATAQAYWTLTGSSTQQWAIGGVPVNPTAAAPPQLQNLSNYPLLVNLTHDTLKYPTNCVPVGVSPTCGHVYNPNGYDITFRASDGVTQLDHELERYDGVNGQVVAWVRLPTVNGVGAGSNTQIYMYYGNFGISSPTQNKAAVWDANYMDVFHLAETSGNATDSTSNNHVGTVNNDSNVTRQAARIGWGYHFGGSSYVVTNDDAMTSNAPFTMEAWFSLDTTPQDWIGIITKNRDINPSPCPDSDPYCDWAGITTGSLPSPALTFIWDWHTQGNMTGATALSPATWYHAVATFDGGIRTVYRSGSPDADISPNPSPGTYINLSLPSRMNRDGVAGYIGTDVIDEVRVSTVARTPGWIRTSYNNMYDPGNIGTPGFYTVGAEENFPPTAIALTSFTATSRGSAVLLEWVTGFEVDNLGFHVYREQGGQRVQITPSLIAGSALFAGAGTRLTSGQTYAWWDRSPVPEASYWLEEWDLSGAKRWHGPVQVQPASVEAQTRTTAAPSVLLAGFGQPAAPSPAQGVRRKLRRVVAPGEDRLAVQWRLASQPALKILVSEEGWYRVTQEELAAAGLDREVDPSRLQLFTEGVPVPILVDGEAGRLGSGEAIEFYGLGLDTPSTGVRVYWLAAGDGPGTRIPEESGGGSWSQGPPSFPVEVERADRTLYVPSLLNGDAENFFGAVVTTTPVSQTVRLQHVERSEEAEVTVRLQGLTLGGHRVGVELNGVRVGTLSWEGTQPGELIVSVPGRMVWDGDNLVALAAEEGERDVSAVEFVRVCYSHTWNADGDALKFSLGGFQEATIAGFGSSQVRVLDVTDPWAALALPADVAKDGSAYRVTVGVSEPGTRTLLAVGKGAVRHPLAVLPNRPSAWHQAREGADLLIIAHRSVLAAVEPLRALRESQGLKVAVVDVESVFDEFSFGARDPQAIRDFLACATKNWSRPPRYLLLVGDASFDPRNYLGYGYADLVPTRLVDTTYLETASDDWFADFDGDGIADIPVGRLPVRTFWEAKTVIDKIAAYDRSARLGRVLFLADANDKENDFEALSGRVRAALPATVWVAEVFRGQLGDGPAKDLLARQLNLGQTLVNYVGHGSNQVWHGNLLTTDEALTLRNYWFPFVASMTCLNGYFHAPYGDSLAEALLKAPSGGAVAVWASSGLTESKYQIPIDEALVRLLFSTTTTLGDATIAAKQATQHLGVRQTWLLFGDPTTRLRP